MVPSSEVLPAFLYFTLKLLWVPFQVVEQSAPQMARTPTGMFAAYCLQHQLVLALDLLFSQ